MSEVTLLIRRAQQGDREAGERAFGLLYADLRTLARRRLSRSRHSVVLETTELVNETYLRLNRAGSIQAQDRAGYLAYASRAMRSVIVDLIRARLSARRGGGCACLTLDTSISNQIAAGEEEILRVHEALEELAAVDARVVRVVEMRYFAGLSEQEVAAALGVTDRTVRRDWEKARLLLAAALKSA
jgi:RNA polymerase sigma factor (TIGR02999 family)